MISETWIPVFRAGRHTDSAGNTQNWPVEQLDKIAANFAEREAETVPVVIGHPKDNSPAYGWVTEIKREADHLYAKVKPTVKEFSDWVKNRLYTHVSLSLYGDDETLRHLGFLGGKPPAVKGLKMPEFQEAEHREIEIKFSEEAGMSEKEKELQKQIEELEQKNKALEEEREKAKKEFSEAEKDREKIEKEIPGVQGAEKGTPARRPQDGAREILPRGREFLGAGRGRQQALEGNS